MCYSTVAMVTQPEVAQTNMYVPIGCSLVKKNLFKHEDSRGYNSSVLVVWLEPHNIL